MPKEVEPRHGAGGRDAAPWWRGFADFGSFRQFGSFGSPRKIG
jgi:hypothetical protein